MNENCFSPQNETDTDKLCFFVVFKHFWGNSLKTSLFSQKSDYLRKNFRLYSEHFFFPTIWIWSKSREKLGFFLNTLFVQSSKIGQIKTKKLFLLKMSPHRVKLCISVVFWPFWGNSQKMSLFSPKDDYLRNKLRNT